MTGALTKDENTWRLTRPAAEVVCRHADDVADARLLLEMVGLVDEGGHELLADQALSASTKATGTPSEASAPIARERPPERSSVPEGLRSYDPTARPQKAKPMPIAPPDVRVDAAQLQAATYVAVLSVVELFVDRSYQRPLDDVRVKRMADAWEPRMLGILDVSDRGPDLVPRYAIVDGQQRWTAAGRRGVQYVACNVHEGLTVADEARLMYDLDRAKKKLSGWDQWRARRGAGDLTVGTVERIAARHGLRVDDNGELRSYGTAEKLLGLGGEELLDSALAVLCAAYGATPLAFQAPLLMAVGRLIKLHTGLDVDRLTRALAGTRPEQLRSTATALREVDGGSLNLLMARAIAGCYNRLPGARIAA